MISSRDLQIGQEFKAELVSKCKVLDIKMFGSRARGDADQYSDYDIFIVVDKRTPEIKDEIRELSWEISLKYNVVLSTLIFSYDELHNSPLMDSPIVKSIEREGIDL